MVSTTTAMTPVPTAAHCTGRSRSFSSSTPIAMVTSGLMKYPSEASTTCPEFTDQMYSTSRAAPTKTSDHTIRWARISTAPAGFSRGQNRGTSPHIP